MFQVVRFSEDKEEEGDAEDEGQEDIEDGQEELQEWAVDVNLLLHLAKVQYFCKEKILPLFVYFAFLISSGDSFKIVLYAAFIDIQ